MQLRRRHNRVQGCPFPPEVGGARGRGRQTTEPSTDWQCGERRSEVKFPENSWKLGKDEEDIQSHKWHIRTLDVKVFLLPHYILITLFCRRGV